MDRRSFLLRTGHGVAGTVLAASILPILSGCSTVPEISARVDDGVAVIPRSAFLVDGEHIDVVLARISGLRFPIAVVAQQNAEPIALLMRCTHKKCPLDAEAQAFVCSCHGSEFDLKGRVTNGPAEEALLALPLTQDTESYRIQMKGVL